MEGVERRVQSSFRNCSTVSPASRIMPPMVKAFTGLWRGIVRMRRPSVITTCLSCRSIRNPTFSKARTLEGEEFPQACRLTRCYFHLADILPARKLLDRFQTLADCLPNILQRLMFGCALRPAPGQSRTRYCEAFFRVLKHHTIGHAVYATPVGRSRKRRPKNHPTRNVFILRITDSGA